MAVLADSFQVNRLRAKLRNFLLVRCLNHRQIEWVGNHNINSSRSLEKAGVDPKKIIPWDWAPSTTPNDFSIKQLHTKSQPFNLFYAGKIIQPKGVGDLLEAFAKLKSKGFDVTLKLAGDGEIEYFTEQVKQLGIEAQVNFLGLVPNNKIIQLMRAADVVVIPSHHDYPEGLPMTIYEALCVHTPIVASDHPMFQGRLVDGMSAMIFPAQNSQALAERIEALLLNPALYHRLSQNSGLAWERLQIPVKFADLLNRWLVNSVENRQYLSHYSLASGIYDRVL